MENAKLPSPSDGIANVSSRSSKLSERGGEQGREGDACVDVEGGNA